MSRARVKKAQNIGDIIGRKGNRGMKRMRVRKSGCVEM